MNESRNGSASVSTPTRRQLLAGVTVSLGGLALSSTGAWAGNEEEVACPAESIHQEPIFKASRKRVYDALSDTKQFNNVTQLSAAMQSGMPPKRRPHRSVVRQVARSHSSAAISLDGISNLCPTSESFQAWRVATWDPGVARPGRTPSGGMESQLLGAAREIPSLTVASLHGEIRREVRDAATWAKKLENRPAGTKAPLATGGSLQCLRRRAVAEACLALRRGSLAMDWG